MSHDLKSTLAFILAGGRGSRLKELTDWRVKPAVPFGGKYRIIDFVLSNCVNSDIRKIGILTQYKSQSLIRHIIRGWDLFHPELDEFIECIPAQKQTGEDWYSGTANAIYQNLELIRYHNPRYVLILAGDHIYKMDYGDLLAFHKYSGASVSIAGTFVPETEAHHFGILNTDENQKVVKFTEKPDHLDDFQVCDGMVMASMGIYIFNADLLVKLLLMDANRTDSHHDFGKDILPSIIPTDKVYAYPFISQETQEPLYWKDVGTVDSYWKASMDLIGISPQLNLYDLEWPIHTATHTYPPAKFIFNDKDRRGLALDSLVSPGCIISGAMINHSLLSTNVRIEEKTVIENSILLPDVRVGSNCRISNAIIDKQCVIPNDMIIGEDHEADKKRFDLSHGGITLVEPEMLGQEVHHIDYP
jgi:glucose-1-phosphate adenylyltransferase